jgi:heme exporter protein A
MKSDNLQLQELACARDGAWVLPPITQQLRAGEVLLVSGRNGCGKSTLLKTVAGLLRPATGEILWNGEPLRAQGGYPANLVYIGHKRGVEPSLSVLAHVKFWARAFRQQELIEAALHYFDLEDIAHTPVHQLSAGWQQRVALTRLITQPGSLWLLDEPTQNLDADGLNLLHSLMQTRSEQGGIIMLASHVPLEGDRVRQLDLNTLTQHGGIDDLHAH